MNLSTALVLCIVIFIVVLAIKSIIHDKKSGKSSCGGDCGICGNPLCHSSQALFEEYKRKELHR